jgi:hypothetical protein
MSNSKLATHSTNVARVMLGLIYLVFGLNFFFHFLPNSAPQGKAAGFVTGLFQSEYFFPFMKAVEVVAGLLLILRFYVPLLLVVLMPISLNILLFHIFLAPSGIGLSAVIIALQLFLAWQYRSSYRNLFVGRPAF